jgi:hypothetical protein
MKKHGALWPLPEGNKPLIILPGLTYYLRLIFGLIYFHNVKTPNIFYSHLDARKINSLDKKVSVKEKLF